MKASQQTTSVSRRSVTRRPIREWRESTSQAGMTRNVMMAGMVHKMKMGLAVQPPQSHSPLKAPLESEMKRGANGRKRGSKRKPGR